MRNAVNMEIFAATGHCSRSYWNYSGDILHFDRFNIPGKLKCYVVAFEEITKNITFTAEELICKIPVNFNGCRNVIQSIGCPCNRHHEKMQFHQKFRRFFKLPIAMIKKYSCPESQSENHSEIADELKIYCQSLRKFPTKNWNTRNRNDMKEIDSSDSSRSVENLIVIDGRLFDAEACIVKSIEG